MTLRVLLAAAVVTLTAGGMDAGEFRIRFQYADEFPPPQIGPSGARRLIVNSENKGIKNVLVYVYTGRAQLNLPKAAPRNQKLEVINQQLTPRVSTAQTGDTLQLINRDQVGYNLNVISLNNVGRNVPLPAGAQRLVQLQQVAVATTLIECNIHPSVKGYIFVLDHPYASVSDEDGNAVIEDLPEGKELTFRVFHEAATGSFDHVMVDGSPQVWPRNRFSVEIGPGVNDYGTVTFTTDQLR